MSTLAAARADNFYYPPEWDPSKGNLNKFNGQHPLRERAKKIDQGILVIRFEMPYHIWCGGCQSMIAQGVRFNAEKKQVGNYYTTKIWSFKMKAACCGQEIEIQTDPKNCEYVVISGAVQKTVTYDEVEAESILLPEQGDKEKLVDPMYRLEHQGEDERKGKQAEPVLVRLQRAADLKHGDSYARNKFLRAELRAQKKRVAAEEADARSKGLGIRLLPVSAADAEEAGSVQFAQKFDHNRRNKRAEIHAASIFSVAPYMQDNMPRKLLTSNSSSSIHNMQLLAKRRKIDIVGVRDLLSGKFKPSSKSSVNVSAQNRFSKPTVKIIPA